MLRVLDNGREPQFFSLLVFKVRDFVQAAVLPEETLLSHEAGRHARLGDREILDREHYLGEPNVLRAHLVTSVAGGAEPYEVTFEHFFLHAEQGHANDLTGIVSPVYGFYGTRRSARLARKTCSDTFTAGLSGYPLFEGGIELVEFHSSH